MEYGITPVFYKNYSALKAKDENGKRKYKYIINTGSSRSSKTFSIIELIHRICEGNENFRVTAWRDTKKDAKDTVWQDFQKVLKLSNRFIPNNRNKTESYYTYPSSNSVFEIHGADDEEKVHGLTQNVSWLNEPYKISEDTFDQIDQRSDLMFIDWNPKKLHWIDKISKLPNAIVIHSTYKDNPFCPIEQKRKIESYEPTEENILLGTADEYKWNVYGLGLKAEKPERVFSFTTISYADYLNIDKETYIGVDWGQNDPFAIVEVKYYDGNLYVHELNYLSENKWLEKLSQEERKNILSNEHGLINWLFMRLNIDKRKDIICDSANPNKIISLRKLGYSRAYGVEKKHNSIIDGISLLKNLNVYYTSISTNIENEQESYSYKKDRYGVMIDEVEDADNHTIDAIRYVVMELHKRGIIRK